MYIKCHIINVADTFSSSDFFSV